MNTSLIWNGINLKWAYTDLLHTVFQRIHCKQLAYDILHDALIKFVLAKNPMRHEQPEAYLTTIVRNLLINNHKELSLFKSIDSDFNDNQTEGFENPLDYIKNEDFSPSPERLLDIMQRVQLLQIVIDSLPPKCREVFWMFRVEGMTQQAIAEHFKISLNMVEKHIIRAFVDLKTVKTLISN